MKLTRFHMFRGKGAGVFVALYCLILICGFASGRKVRVIDAESGLPVARVSVYDRGGRMIGTADDQGVMPIISSGSLPVTLRSLGYEDLTVGRMEDSVIGMARRILDLPEVTVNTRRRPILHLTGYVRELSSMSTYMDTVRLYREKWVDFMIPTGKEKHFKGWLSPRLLSSKSYYRFTDCQGNDSVSDRSTHHFSWSDWISLPRRQNLPLRVKGMAAGRDTLMGKYSPVEIWQRDSDRVEVEVNILADRMKGKWMPRLESPMWSDMEFERLVMGYAYSDVDTFAVKTENIDRMMCYIESTGRGHRMFRFNRDEEEIYVCTYMDLTIVDREYITVKEAKRKEKDHLGSLEEARMVFQSETLPRDSLINDLIARVNSIDHDGRRLSTELDMRVGNGRMPTPPGTKKQNLLRSAKRLFGIR